MEELLVNLHMHTFYSDGHVSHEQIAEAAQHAGLDVVIVTDHNVWVNGPEGYYKDKGKQVLLLVGEEVHAGLRLPEGIKPLLEDLDRLAREAPELARLVSEVRLVPLTQERFELLLYPVAYRIRLRLGGRLEAESLRSALVILDLLERQNLQGRVEELDLRTRDVVYRIKEEG